MNEYEEVVRACSYLLESYPGAEKIRQYVRRRASTDAIKKFGFGYFPDAKNFDALLSIVSEDTLYRAKLRYDRFDIEGVTRKLKSNTFEHHNLIMPYRDVYGNIVALVGRTLLSDKDMKENKVSKYKNTSFEKKAHVFGLDTARDAILQHDCVFVVEGQFDCIAAQERGIKNVVALGSAAMTLYQLGLLLRYTRNVYLFLDNDEAGKAGTNRVMNRYASYANITPKQVPCGYKDLDELLNDGRDLTWQDLIRL